MKQLSQFLCALLVLIAAADRLTAVTISIDYSFDTANFFNTPAKKDMMQRAADSVASRLSDNLSAITPGGVSTWQTIFFNPATGAIQMVNNPTIPANTIVIYAGGHDLGGSTLGQGGPGGYNNASGTAAFINAVSTRGQGTTQGASANDFGPWGGSVTFTNNASINWNYTSASPPPGQYDFFSVAEHEIAHALGFGESDSWKRLISGNKFVGSHATSVFGANVPLSTPDLGHWASGTANDGHLTTMTPSIASGVRSAFTTLDFAGLQDLGWTLAADGIPGDVNHDGVVNAADIAAVAGQWLTVGPLGDANRDTVVNATDIAIVASHWLQNAPGGAAAVPEPGTCGLAILAFGAALLGRNRLARRR